MIPHKVTYVYKNWEVVLHGNEILFKCTISDGAVTQTLMREYKMPANRRNIIMEDEYLRIEQSSGLMTQYKMQDDYCLIGDVFHNGNHDESIAMHDFWDDFDY